MSTFDRCCLSNCEKNPQNVGSDVQVDLSSLELPDAKDIEFEGLLDESWMLEVADYEAELLETVPFCPGQLYVCALLRQHGPGGCRGGGRDCLG